jgi:hypothetical protein
MVFSCQETVMVQDTGALVLEAQEKVPEADGSQCAADSSLLHCDTS